MRPTIEAELEILQRESFSYFVHETNPDNGLVIDKTAPDWPASIAAIGFALAAYAAGTERGFMSRAAAVQRTLSTLRFFWNSRQGRGADATGYQGFYYHFLDMQTGRRAWQCELSTVDSAFLLAGMLTARSYFDADTMEEQEIRTLADALYRRANWQWAQNHGATLTHGWTPEGGFLPYRWEGYDEALLLYVLALGSPTYPLPASSYEAWSSTYQWEHSFGYDYLYAGSLFTHQLSHIFYGYGSCCWGITASDGPGPDTIKVDGVERRFFGYLARAVPHGPDDGTIAPWAVVASLPFAPKIVLPAINHFIHRLKLKEFNSYGFKATFNATYPGKTGGASGWVSPWHYGLNQGPIVLMIENYRSGLFWRLTRNCSYICSGLRRAGFTGAWL